MRVASAPLTVVPGPGLSMVTPMSERPFRVASNSSQWPAARVYPVLMPVAPRYVPSSGSVFRHT